MVERSRGVGTQFEALLLEQVLKPLAGALGPFGEIALQSAALRVAAADEHGFAALIERTIDRGRSAA